MDPDETEYVSPKDLKMEEGAEELTGAISIEVTMGTFLLCLDTHQQLSLTSQLVRFY
jgi:hypothetical protein